MRKFTREGAAVSSRYSPRIRSPLGGHTGTRRARRGGCAGVGRARRKDGGVPRRARRGLLPGRRGQGAVSGDATGASGARRAGAFLPGGGGKPGTGGLGRVRRTKAAWRALRRGAGTWPGGAALAVCGAFRGGRGEGATGGGRGGKAGAAPRCRGRGGRRRGQNGCTQRGLCRVSSHLCDRGGSAGEKARFCLIRKRFFPGAALVKSELFCARILVASVGLLFRRRGVMNVSRRAGRAKSPAGKRNDQAKGAHPHEKPDLRYRD